MTHQQLIKKLTELRSLPGETEVVEFKEANNAFDFTKLGKYFSALCNEANLKGKSDAWLIFGVENSHRNIVGSNYRHRNRPYLDSLKGEIAKKTTHRITFIEIHELELARNPDLILEEIMMLDKVQKKKELNEDEIKHLKGKSLIEGRRPNFIIAEKVALKTDQIGAYLKNRGFDKMFYKKLILEFIQKKREGASKAEVRELIWSKLPDVLTTTQKEHKISHILRELRQESSIINTGSDAKPCWKSIS